MFQQWQTELEELKSCVEDRCWLLGRIKALPVIPFTFFLRKRICFAVTAKDSFYRERKINFHRCQLRILWLCGWKHDIEIMVRDLYSDSLGNVCWGEGVMNS